MSGLAKILLKKGALVSGSDMAGGFTVQRLNKLGADIKIGHWEKWLEKLGDEVEAVVVSAAIKEDNPELIYARKKGFAVYKYSQMLGELMKTFRGIAVAGTHGKSTSSAWLGYVMGELGVGPNYIIGADVPQLEGSSGVGNGDFFIAEACEYDRSFLNLSPEIGVVLNIEQDHLDYYHNEKSIIEAFADFACCIKKDGTLIANIDDSNYDNFLKIYRERKLTKGCPDIKFLTFGIDKPADYSAEAIQLVNGLYEFNVCFKGYTVGRVKLNMPGKHNIYNALAVIASAATAGIDMTMILSVMGGFVGADRRLMVKAEIAGVKVLDDYAHHPTEIKASLKAIRQRYNPERLICIFQPHQYSRTRFLLEDFAESFKLADITVVPEIYFVRDTEESRREINAQILVDKIKENGCESVFIDSFAGIGEYLKKNVDSGDVVVTMGAGDIWKVADEFIQWLRRDS